MTTSPPSATAGSVLYMPLAAVQRSSYMRGITASTRSTGSSSQMMWRRADRAAAARHASRGAPQKRPATPSCVTTRARSETGVSGRDAGQPVGVAFLSRGEPVQDDGPFVREAARGEGGTPAGRVPPDIGEGAGVVPTLVKDPDPPRLPVRDRSSHEPAQRRVVHGHVG